MCRYRRSGWRISEAHTILEAIHPATVRAVCYQLFTRNVIDSMGKNNTNRVSVQLRDARQAGSIPWEWIVDETREAECINAWRPRRTSNPCGDVIDVIGGPINRRTSKCAAVSATRSM